jgi:formylglycine-generating enzyme required for sulfatase activity
MRCSPTLREGVPRTRCRFSPSPWSGFISSKAATATSSSYQELGGVKGSIEAAVERALKAADVNPKIPRDREARFALLRRGLIPWLAGIDPETGSPRRRVARLSEIPPESRPLIDLLVDQRLLSTDVSKETGEITIEPVHEALLRQWGLMQGWLAQDLPALATLQSVKRASRDWAANNQDSTWLTHTGERLKAAEQLADRPDLAENLEPTDRNYLAACQEAEHSAKRGRRRMQALAGALGLLLAAAGIGWWAGPHLQEQAYWRFSMRPAVLTEGTERALRPNDEFSECASGCPVMRVIPSGTFRMTAKGTGIDVAIAKPLAVGKYEVTFAEWDACVAAGGCPQADDGGWGRGQRPVINVNWLHAEQYASWLARLSGKPYRLLSEEEWEYVARAKTLTPYFFGDDPAELGDYAWYAANSDFMTQPVGGKKPNPFGLYDMVGNVWEWVEDCQHPSYAGAPTDGSAWLAGNCDRRVHRGGSWSNDPEYLRSDSAIGGAAGLYGKSLGFRVARTLNQ